MNSFNKPDRKNQPSVKDGFKFCSTCGCVKALVAFNKRKASADGKMHKCADCSKEICRQWREAHPDAFSDWYKQHRDGRAEYWRAWYSKNAVARSKSYREWVISNKHVKQSLVMKRYAAKKHATPRWADQDAIREFYKLASFLTETTGIRHEVDHIVPLQGRSVRGLHWEGNLQVLTKTDNLRKLNKLELS